MRGVVTGTWWTCCGSCCFPLLYLMKGGLMSVLRERVTMVWLGLMALDQPEPRGGCPRIFSSPPLGWWGFW